MGSPRSVPVGSRSRRGNISGVAAVLVTQGAGLSGLLCSWPRAPGPAQRTRVHSRTGLLAPSQTGCLGRSAGPGHVPRGSFPGTTSGAVGYRRVRGRLGMVELSRWSRAGRSGESRSERAPGSSGLGQFIAAEAEPRGGPREARTQTANRHGPTLPWGGGPAGCVTSDGLSDSLSLAFPGPCCLPSVKSKGGNKGKSVHCISA